MSPEDPKLTAFLLGELSREEQQEIEAEIAHSPELQVAVTELRELISRLDDSASAFDSENTELSELQQQQIRSAAQTLASSSKPSVAHPASSGFGWLRLATAATVIFAIGLTALALYRPDNATQVASTFRSVFQLSEESDALETSSNSKNEKDFPSNSFTEGDRGSVASTNSLDASQALLEQTKDSESDAPPPTPGGMSADERRKTTNTDTRAANQPASGNPMQGGPGFAEDRANRQFADSLSPSPMTEPKSERPSFARAPSNEFNEFADESVRGGMSAGGMGGMGMGGMGTATNSEMGMDNSDGLGSALGGGELASNEGGYGGAGAGGGGLFPGRGFEGGYGGEGGMYGGGMGAGEMGSGGMGMDDEMGDLGMGSPGDEMGIGMGMSQATASSSQRQAPNLSEVDFYESSGEGAAPRDIRLSAADNPALLATSAQPASSAPGSLQLFDPSPGSSSNMSSNLHPFHESAVENKSAAQMEEEQIKTWRPATASPNAARLSVGHHDDLVMSARDSYVRIDGYRARVLLDYYYYNDRPQQLEGSFKLRLPADASLHYFAFGAVNVNVPPAQTIPNTPGKGGDEPNQLASVQERTLTSIRRAIKTSGADLARRATDSNFQAKSDAMFKDVKTARIVERQKAALAYEETVRRRVDPALVEWSGPGIFQTKVFPLLPHKMHRIVIGYDVDLQEVDGVLTFDLDLPEEQAGGRVEFDVAATPGSRVTLTPECEAFVSGDRAYYRFEVSEAQDYSVKVEQPGPILLTSNSTEGSFFATQAILDLPDQPIAGDSDHAVFLLDTSWSQQTGAFHRWVELLQQILASNEKEIKSFNVLFFNVEQRWWRKSSVQNTPENRNRLQEACEQLILEGATDLEGALASAIEYCEQTRSTEGNIPNLFLLSNGTATWGQSDLASIAEPLRAWQQGLQDVENPQGGSLFCYSLSGLATDKVVLQHLAKTAGGSVFSVKNEGALETAAKAHLSRPWILESVEAAGTLDLLSGGTRTVYPMQKLEITGKGIPSDVIQITLRRGNETKELSVAPASRVDSPLAERIYGGQAVEQLEPFEEDYKKVLVAYSRQFRVPGRVCSMVMLESEADYARFNIEQQEDPLVVRTTNVASLLRQAAQKATELRADAKRSFTRWIESLETSSTPLLKQSTALKLAIEQMPASTFSLPSKPLKCSIWHQEDADLEYRRGLRTPQPDVDILLSEAERRLIQAGAADALKVASTAVEISPADPSTLRIIAFNAIHWDRSDQAAHLLRRLTIARPYQPQSLLLLARCFSDAGKADAAMVCYELVASGLWNPRWQGNKPIAELALLHLLEEIEAGTQTSSVPAYASARLEQLRRKLAANGLDLVVVMHWNTDRTDVDLHVTEPNGEECYYKNNATRSGGSITQDITEGLGPEMYKIASAPAGEYSIAAKYFRSDANVTKAPTATLVTVYRNLGRSGSSSRTQLARLERPDAKLTVMTASVRDDRPKRESKKSNEELD